MVGEGFMTSLNNKICKYMTAKSKKVYIVKLPERVYDHYNTIHAYTKMKPLDVKPKTYIGLTLIFKGGDHVRISMYNIYVFKG